MSYVPYPSTPNGPPGARLPPVVIIGGDQPCTAHEPHCAEPWRGQLAAGYLEHAAADGRSGGVVAAEPGVDSAVILAVHAAFGLSYMEVAQ